MARHGRTIERRARGDRVILIARGPTRRCWRCCSGRTRATEFVPGNSPLARRAQFAITDEIPFFDPDAATVMREEKFVPIQRFSRPRGGAVATLLERP